MKKMREVSETELKKFEIQFSRKLDEILPYEVRSNAIWWAKFYELYDAELIPFLKEIIRREQEVRDSILTDMQKDSVAYNEGYGDGVEAVLKKLRSNVEDDIKKGYREVPTGSLKQYLETMTVDPPSRK